MATCDGAVVVCFQQFEQLTCDLYGMNYGHSIAVIYHSPCTCYEEYHNTVQKLQFRTFAA